jgi:hypothetical protein
MNDYERIWSGLHSAKVSFVIGGGVAATLERRSAFSG